MRLKIIAGNLLTVLLVGVVAYSVLRSDLEQGLGREVDRQIGNDARLFDRSWRLSATEFVELVVDRASSRDVRDAFGALDENSRRTRAHQVANRVSQWFLDPARQRGGAPDIVAIVDETGKVIARDQDQNRLFGESLTRQLPAVRSTLNDGQPRHDLWNRLEQEDKLYQTGVAVVRNADGGILGALVVAYDISNGVAKREASLLGCDVAFLSGGKVYSSSLPADRVQSLKKLLFEDMGDNTQAALKGERGVGGPWRGSMGGDEWVGVTASLPMTGSTPMAFAVMTNRTERLGLASSANIVIILTILGAILVLVYGFVVGTQLTKPLEEIEEGVLAIINGRTDHRLDIESQEFGGLAYRINQLVNVFLGVSEEGETGGATASSWGEDSSFAVPQAGAPAAGGASGKAPAGDVVDDPSISGPLAAEPEDAYFERLYNEYVAAKSAVGENVSNIPLDRFRKRMEGNAKALATKHGVAGVRFQIQTVGTQVKLVPVLLR